MNNIKLKQWLGAAILLILPAWALAGQTASPKDVSYSTSDGGTIHGHLYGDGEHAVLLAHGKIFNKESWSRQAPTLASAGLRVLAIDFRGYGESRAGGEQRARHLDILGGIAWLKSQGAKKVSVIGGSMGGGIAASAATQAKAGEIHKLILLSPMPTKYPQQIKADAILYTVSEGETRLLPRVREQYERAPDPKRLEIIPGSAHAQHIFKTEQADMLLKLIREFLLAS